jgi:pimeloyl-ACP methyl ester carboxylesterase
MTGTKATFLHRWCAERGRAFLRFDYSGHGRSTGDFADGTIGSWADDALAAFDALTDGPQILVGSSMGGWIMLILALARPERVAGLVGIAAAPDFSQNLWLGLSREERERVERDGVIELVDDSQPYSVTRQFFEDGRHHLMLRGPLAISCPVRLLQGMRDTAVPWSTATTLADRLTGADVALTLIKDGDHRLSRDRDLDRLAAAIDELVA